MHDGGTTILTYVRVAPAPQMRLGGTMTKRSTSGEQLCMWKTTPLFFGSFPILIPHDIPTISEERIW